MRGSPSLVGDGGSPRESDSCAADGSFGAASAAAVGVDVRSVAFGGAGKPHRCAVRGAWSLNVSREGAGESISMNGVVGAIVTCAGSGEMSSSRRGGEIGRAHV
mgnify:FL=1